MKKKLFTCLFVAIIATVNVSASDVYVPEKMSPGTVITYDNDLNMTIVEGGFNRIRTSSDMRSAAINSHRNIIMSDDLSSYSTTEMSILQDIINDTLPLYTVESEPVVATPNSTVVYDGMGSIYKIKTTTFESPRLTSWTYPPNGTYYYGEFNPQSWIRLTSDYVMGQGYVTYFYDEIGYHGDNLDEMEEDDPDLHICATKMAYDRPNRGQEIKLRVLDSNWTDTDDVYYVYKYDIGGLPEAILDLRERLFSEITDLDNGIFHGRYFYEKVPLTDPY